MKICIYGAGAVGGVIAARLALSGAPVSVVARGAHLASIRQSRLRLTIGDAERVAQVEASDDPTALGPQDVVIVAVKAHQLSAVVEGLERLMKPQTAVVYAVNGIPWWYFHPAHETEARRRLGRLDPGGRLWDRIGPERTIGCVVNFPGVTLGPGRVRQPVGNNRIALGELDDSTTGRLTALAGLLRSAGFQVDTERPIRQEVWRKLDVMVVSPISVLTGAPPGLAFRDPAIRAAAARVYREVFATAAAYGYPQADDVSSLVAAQVSLNKPSMLQDLEAGRPIEIDAQLVAPCELAHEA
jgi:2-dehydropantoate 2-reductase